MSAYTEAAHRIQTAIAVLMDHDPNYAPAQPKHLRTGIDLSKADMAELANLLIAKGVFTQQEYIEAVTAAAKVEADSYEKTVQAVLGNRSVKTV